MIEIRERNAPLAQDFTRVWHNPDRSFYVEGCGLVTLGDGIWLAIVPVIPRHRDPLFARRSELSRVHIVRSDDDGVTWEKTSEVPYYSAAAFVHAGDVYLFANMGGTDYRNDDLLLMRSSDRGYSWSDPTTLLEGHYWNCQTGMARRNGKIYWAVDDLSFGDPVYRGPLVVAGNLSRDLLDADSWQFSNTVPFPGLPDMMKDPVQSVNSPLESRIGKYLEPNVIDVYGRLRVLSAVRKNGMCAVFDLADDERGIRLTFTQYHPMPCGSLKFCVVWDDVSRMFWAATNPSVNSQELVDWSDMRDAHGDYHGGDRRLLMLYYSLDGLNWMQAGCVAQAAKLTQAFGYPTLVIDGDDLGIIARSNIDGPSPHDVDCATFHRVRHFRSLAMQISPQRID